MRTCLGEGSGFCKVNSSYTISYLWRKSVLIFMFVLSEIVYVYLRIYMYIYTQIHMCIYKCIYKCINGVTLNTLLCNLPFLFYNKACSPKV